MDLGNRFRILLSEVDVVEANAALPKLPVARAMWEPRPDFKTAATAWSYAGGAHHTVFSQSLNTEHMADYAEIAGVEFVKIDAGTTLYDFKNELRWNDASYLLTQRL
jgi:L-arabinose isomerase